MTVQKLRERERNEQKKVEWIVTVNKPNHMRSRILSKSNTAYIAYLYECKTVSENIRVINRSYDDRLS